MGKTGFKSNLITDYDYDLIWFWVTFYILQHDYNLKNLKG